METLNELLSKSAQEWTDDEVLQLIEALRTQRERWSAEQQTGSKKRVTSANVKVKPANKDIAFEGLKL